MIYNVVLRVLVVSVRHIHAVHVKINNVFIFTEKTFLFVYGVWQISILFMETPLFGFIE